MIFKLYYWFMAAGANALGILMGVFIATYFGASATEIGFIYMLMPFTGIIFRPIICSYADRKQAHQKYLIVCLLITSIGYTPFVLIPLLGPDVYLKYPRICWYFFLAFKVIGDIAFGGADSIGDSLAINYAHRIGTDYGVYRVWATISWMVFGVVSGQINEIWFLPKYVPAFMILISAGVINMTLIWLWPREYFMMVPVKESLRNGETLEEEISSETNRLESGENKEPASKQMSIVTTKSLMPKEVVWAHSKRKLLSLLTCSCFSLEDDYEQAKKPTMDMRMTQIVGSNSDGDVLDEETEAKAGSEQQKRANSAAAKEVDRGTQIRILLLLLRRDPRILLYAAMFICAGATVVPLSFFYMSLSELCQTENRCNFSQLGGFLQVSMAIGETILFIYIKRIINKIGRLNTVSIAFAMAACKYTFYGTLWSSVNPYFALISELLHGAIFGIYLVLSVELAHFFANEVEFLIPELVESGLVRTDDEESCAKLKMSLSATMQAIMASANEGLGRGVGALIYGLLLDHYSYVTLWRIIGVGSTVVFVIIQSINTFDRYLHFELGLDVQFEKGVVAEAAAKKKLASLTRDSRSLHDSLDTLSVHSNRSKLQKIA